MIIIRKFSLNSLNTLTIMAEFLYIAVPIVTSLIGRGFIDSAIKESAVSTYKLLYSFVDHPEIDIELQKLDIKATMRCVRTIMNNIQFKDISEPIYDSLKLLHQTMCNISDDLSKLNYTVNTYKKKWFKRWRRAEYKQYLVSIEINTRILEKRLDNFYKLLEVSDKFPSITNTYTFREQKKYICNKHNESTSLVVLQYFDNTWDTI